MMYSLIERYQCFKGTCSLCFDRSVPRRRRQQIPLTH